MLRGRAALALLGVLHPLGSDSQPLPAALEQLRNLGAGGAGANPQAPWQQAWQAATVAANGGVAQPEEPARVAPTAAERGPMWAESIGAKSAQVERSKVPLPSDCVKPPVADYAYVTLVTTNSGYPAGALAIASALEVMESRLRRICLVTDEVEPGIRELLRSASWEVVVVDVVRCNQVMGPGITSDQYDLGPEYQQKKAKWITTCTKFHLWNLTHLKKLIYLDADVLPIKSIDDLIDHPSAFAAAPDTFPADQFNSGVMVIQPSAVRFQELLEWNRVNGTAEGGDQCMLNGALPALDPASSVL